MRGKPSAMDSGANIRVGSFEIRSDAVRYVVCTVQTVTVLAANICKQLSIVRHTPTGQLLPPEPVPQFVTSEPTQGYAPLGYVAQGAGAAWVCSFSLDFRLSGALAMGASSLTVQGNGFSGAQSPVSGIAVGDIVGIQTDEPAVTHWTTVDSVVGSDVGLSEGVPIQCSAGRRACIIRWT